MFYSKGFLPVGGRGGNHCLGTYSGEEEELDTNEQKVFLGRAVTVSALSSFESSLPSLDSNYADTFCISSFLSCHI